MIYDNPTNLIQNPFQHQGDKFAFDRVETEKNEDDNYLQTLLNQYREEVTLLKEYITLINTEIRKNLNIEIPSFEDAFQSALSEIGADPLDENIINSWMSRLMNIEYINPLIKLYSRHICNLEAEIKNLNQITKKYEKTISKLVSENNDLRNELKIRNDEYKSFLGTKLEDETGKTIIKIDKDSYKKIQDRVDVLSRENDILAINYHKVQKEIYDAKFHANEVVKIANEKVASYDNLYQDYQNVNSRLDVALEKIRTNELKLFQENENCNSLAVENQNLKEELSTTKSALLKATSDANYYKELVNKWRKANDEEDISNLNVHSEQNEEISKQNEEDLSKNNIEESKIEESKIEESKLSKSSSKISKNKDEFSKPSRDEISNHNDKNVYFTDSKRNPKNAPQKNIPKNEDSDDEFEE